MSNKQSKEIIETIATTEQVETTEVKKDNFIVAKSKKALAWSKKHKKEIGLVASGVAAGIAVGVFGMKSKDEGLTEEQSPIIEGDFTEEEEYTTEEDFTEEEDLGSIEDTNETDYVEESEGE